MAFLLHRTSILSFFVCLFLLINLLSGFHLLNKFQNTSMSFQFTMDALSFRNFDFPIRLFKQNLGWYSLPHVQTQIPNHQLKAVLSIQFPQCSQCGLHIWQIQYHCYPKSFKQLSISIKFKLLFTVLAKLGHSFLLILCSCQSFIQGLSITKFSCLRQIHLLGPL